MAKKKSKIKKFLKGAAKAALIGGALYGATKLGKRAKSKSASGMDDAGRGVKWFDHRLDKIDLFFHHFGSLPIWFQTLWITVVASIFGIKGTQVFRNGGKKK